MVFQHLPLFLSPSCPQLGREKRHCVCLCTCGQQRKVYASWTRSQNLWLSVEDTKGGTRYQFFSTKPKTLPHINVPRPAISDGWWSESKSDRNRKETSICPRWGRRAWMSRIDEGEKFEQFLHYNELPWVAQHHPRCQHSPQESQGSHHWALEMSSKFPLTAFKCLCANCALSRLGIQLKTTGLPYTDLGS